jgi:peptide/nickel transport system permease protein
MITPAAATPRTGERRKSNWARTWYKFRRNPTSVIGLVVVLLIVLIALLAPYVTPFPRHAGSFTDFANASIPPNSTYIFGTDTIGRDVFTRVVFGYRLSLLLGVVVLALAVPVGVILGLCAGYFGGWTETIIMRITDVFLSIPPLVLALAIMGFLPPTLTNAMIAVSVMWWPWYTRLVYNLTRSLRSEGYVAAAEVIGASPFHILVRELLPNCAPSILTKMTLDLGFVILIASSLSFLGLGVQPPTPDLGTMVADGMRYLPDLWWLSLFPGLAILVLVLALNLLGDGLRDALGADV